MTKAWWDILDEYGWDTPLSELTWAITLQDDDFTADIVLENGIIKRAAGDVGFKALGTFVAFSGRNSCELKQKMASAWRAFHKYSGLLCSKKRKYCKPSTVLRHPVTC